jgi:hypothetical protein
MADGMQVSARSVANLLAQVFGPSFYDALYPHFDRGNLDRHDLIDLVSGPRPEPWRAVMLNPQPLPPKELYALALADAHIHELLALDRAGALLGGEVAERTLDRGLRILAEVDELCPPLWPRWRKGWPPPRPPWENEQMTNPELFVLGTRFLAAAELIEQENLQAEVVRLGEKVLDQSLQG